MPIKHRILPELNPQDVARFWSKVGKGQPDDCWPWAAAQMRTGYGRFAVARVICFAHRIAYLIAHGPFPHQLCVLHTCDNPPCCNPSHLRLGTDADNYQDMANKGRHVSPKGEVCGTAKLTAEDVLSIRRRYAAGCVRPGYAARGVVPSLAAEYGLHLSAIGRIVRRERWKHIA